MKCLSQECVQAYLDKLEKSIADYMEMPASQRSSEAVNSMIDAWDHVKGLSDKLYNKNGFTEEDAKAWCDHMINSDGSKGGHWTVQETNSVGRPEDISDYMWNATMNMMYSDYSDVASKYGVNTPEFYADMAEAFLYDEDAASPEMKLNAYYNHIAKDQTK